MRERIPLIVVLLACAVAILRTLFIHSFNAPWVPIERMMDFTADPPWTHRVLFVWLANAYQAVRPEASAFQAYFVSQIIPALLAVTFMTKLASRFVPQRETWLAPVLLTLILIPTFTYRTFFDIGIVAVFALGLEWLFAGHLIRLLALIAVGTLNHEITLFLIPLFGLLYFDRARSKLWLIGWVALQLIVYVGVRLALSAAIPVEAMWQGGKVAYNLGLITGLSPVLAFGVGALLFWFVFAALGWSRVTPMLRRCVWLLPVIVAEVFFVGQLNEPRQFDAFLPILVLVIMQGVSNAAMKVDVPIATR